MLTKDDFQRSISETVSRYPALSPLHQVKDPRMLQSLEAIATMLSMVSAQVDVGLNEPFLKSRDATVLADAAMRGIIPKATPARATVKVVNTGTADYTLDTARGIVDSSGRLWFTQTAPTIRPGETGFVDCIQKRTVSITHTVNSFEPFYSIEIPPAVDESQLAGFSLRDADGEWSHRERYTNTWPGERVYHVEADDRKRVFIRFGVDSVVGVQPHVGHEFTLDIAYTFGDFVGSAAGVPPPADSPFAFEYIQSPAENALTLTMHALLEPGSSPMDIVTLRDLARYPSVYEHNAVFLGEFDFLVRRHFPTLRFLSVWNEQREELARGANIDHINTLFVACLSQDGTEPTLTQPDPQTPLMPSVIAPAALTGTQQAIRDKILEADDSYKIKFYTPVRSKITCTIRARVSSVYIASAVRDKVTRLVLDEYGEEASASKRGDNRPLYRRIYALIREKIFELNDANADLVVEIAEPASPRPELWRYIAPDSLSVTVATENTAIDAWGVGG